jgi:hypothetical protein
MPILPDMEVIAYVFMGVVVVLMLLMVIFWVGSDERPNRR